MLADHTRQEVLSYPVDSFDERHALHVVAEAWKIQSPLHIVTLNAEMVIAAQRDARLNLIIRKAGMIVPDGSGVVWALRLKQQKVNRLPGIELAFAILKLAAKTGRKVALIGGKPQVLEKLRSVLVQEHPGLNIVATHDGYYRSDEEESIAKELSKTEPDLLLVALGVPKQEYFIEQFQPIFPHTIMIGVGGSFDVWAGTVMRAPMFCRRWHLEWLYRLLSEPHRAKRIFQALPKFAVQVLVEEIKLKIGTKNRQ